MKIAEHNQYSLTPSARQALLSSAPQPKLFTQANGHAHHQRRKGHHHAYVPRGLVSVETAGSGRNKPEQQMNPDPQRIGLAPTKGGSLLGSRRCPRCGGSKLELYRATISYGQPVSWLRCPRCYWDQSVFETQLEFSFSESLNRGASL
jgi:hypothetical protein